MATTRNPFTNQPLPVLPNKGITRQRPVMSPTPIGGVGMPAPQNPGMPFGPAALRSGDGGTSQPAPPVYPVNPGQPVGGGRNVPVAPGQPAPVVPGQPTIPNTPRSGPVAPGQPAPNLPNPGPGVPPSQAMPSGRGVQATASSGPNSFAPGNVVQDIMNQFLSPTSAYMENARQRGIEAAAARGMSNSSIAAGASQRAALEAAQPLVNQAMGLLGQREQNAFTGEQNQLSRDQERILQESGFAFQAGQNQLTRDQERVLQEAGFAFTGNQAELDRNLRTRLQSDAATQQDWLASRSFNREFYGAISMMPINSAYQMNTLLQQYALDNPQIYTPTVISGMTNFFQQNFMQMLRDYFPDAYGPNAGGTP